MLVGRVGPHGILAISPSGIAPLLPPALATGKWGPPPPLNVAGDEPRRHWRLARGIEMTHRPERQRAEPGGAEPERRGERRQRADHAPMGEREQYELPLLRPALGGAAFRGCDQPGRLVGDPVDEVGERRAAGVVP